MPRCSIALACLLLVAPAFAAELAVGPGKPFARLEDALAKARPGDTLLVYPLPDGKAYEKTALSIACSGLTLRGVADNNRRVPLSGSKFDYSGRGRIPRAIVQFNPGADGCILENFELFDAHNDSFNGAGVRINQASTVTVRNCDIHDNDMGIMSNGDGSANSGADQLIERCVIHGNGSRKQPGYNHNLYLGGRSVRVVGCEIYSSLTGHNLKSRAHQTSVLYCYIHDSANRELDLVDAKGVTTIANSDAFLIGNLIMKDPRCAGNRGVIHFGTDGGNDHCGTLFLAHNTIVTPFVTPVVQLTAPGAWVLTFDNLIGSISRGGVLK